ncbi:MAG: hypothetical protein F6K39_30815 [Okeania sp. SIO3B3]|nr:hypothetical protein [Okeania sp. SIO3B3]
MYKTTEGGVDKLLIWHLDAHLERLKRSIEKAGLKPAHSIAEIKQGCIDVVKYASMAGYIRPQVMFGLSTLSLGATGVTDAYVLFWPMKKYRDNDGVTLVSSTIERLSPKAADVTAKIAGFYTNSHFNHEYAKSQMADDAVMLDVEGNVAEVSSANVFIVKNGVLKTPRLGYTLEGITRQSVITLAKDLGIPVEETDLTFDDLRSADELFLTGTAAEIEPCIIYDGRALPVGETTKALKERFDMAKLGQLPAYETWYTKVV